MWERAGEFGFVCPWVPEEYGGSGGDFLYSVVVMEELARHRITGMMMPLHSDVVVPYIYAYGNEEQKQKWLPGLASGELVSAVAMTEPDTGSDLKAIRTTAIADGDDYIINGQKTFISNGQVADLVVVVAKTNPKAKVAEQGISLIVVEKDRPGFSKGKKLKKIGLHAQDTSELYLEDCRVPKENLLGRSGRGFLYLMQQLQQERLTVAIGAAAAAETALNDTLRYVKEREAFGAPLAKMQYIQYKLADVATEVEIGKTFVYDLIRRHMAKDKIVKEVSMAKYWITEMLQRTVDTCLQFHGGYGYMSEYPIAKDFVDARVQSIYAGSNEVMRMLVARQLGL
jgi:acyl-CoA dehydrogenase